MFQPALYHSFVLPLIDKHKRRNGSLFSSLNSVKAVCSTSCQSRKVNHKVLYVMVPAPKTQSFEIDLNIISSRFPDIYILRLILSPCSVICLFQFSVPLVPGLLQLVSLSTFIFPFCPSISSLYC